MPRKYVNNFKSMIVNLIVNEKHSTIKSKDILKIEMAIDLNIAYIEYINQS